MNSLLAKCAPSRWGLFLNIPRDAPPEIPEEDQDLFVGKEKSVTITLEKDTVTKFRDIVVLGKLTIQSSDSQDTQIKPSLVIRDLFNAGNLSTKNISIRCRNWEQFKNTETFYKDLRELFLEWLNFQKESEKKIGLRSILA